MVKTNKKALECLKGEGFNSPAQGGLIKGKEMRKRILIIDDDVDLCFELSEALKTESYSVKAISDPKKAQAEIKKDAYEIIILDYKMPQINGADILKYVRDKKLKCKIFLTSGKPFIEKMVEDENLTHLVAGFLNKPFSIDQLLEKIKAE